MRDDASGIAIPQIESSGRTWSYVSEVFDQLVAALEAVELAAVREQRRLESPD